MAEVFRPACPTATRWLRLPGAARPLSPLGSIYLPHHRRLHLQAANRVSANRVHDADTVTWCCQASLVGRFGPFSRESTPPRCGRQRCRSPRAWRLRLPGPRRSVLAHIARAVQTSDRHPQPDDSTQHGLNKRLRCVCHCPRLRTPRLRYDDPCGSVALREALQGYLWRARGLQYEMDQIVVVNVHNRSRSLCAVASQSWRPGRSREPLLQPRTPNLRHRRCGTHSTRCGSRGHAD